MGGGGLVGDLLIVERGGLPCLGNSHMVTKAHVVTKASSKAELYAGGRGASYSVGGGSSDMLETPFCIQEQKERRELQHGVGANPEL